MYMKIFIRQQVLVAQQNHTEKYIQGNRPELGLYKAQHNILNTHYIFNHITVTLTNLTHKFFILSIGQDKTSVDSN